MDSVQYVLAYSAEPRGCRVVCITTYPGGDKDVKTIHEHVDRAEGDRMAWALQTAYNEGCRAGFHEATT